MWNNDEFYPSIPCEVILESPDNSESVQLDCFEHVTPKKNVSPTSRSPGSSGKYYSPTKRRRVNKRTPIKRNLNKDFDTEDDQFFKELSSGLDDKSIFLLKIIKEYLNNESLKCLLDENSQNILSKCFNAMKPGITVVCRLFWRQTIWYRHEELLKICKNSKSDNPSNNVLQELVDNGLLTCGSAVLDINDYSKMLSANDLKSICKDLKLKINTKEEALQSLKSYSQQKSIASFFNPSSNKINNSQRVLNIMKEKCGDCYKLSDMAREALKQLYVLMYLGANYSWISEGKLELVLINDKAQIETYPIDKNMKLDNGSVVFKSHFEFAKYYNALTTHEKFLNVNSDDEKKAIVLEVYELYKNISEEDMLCYQSHPDWLKRFTPAHYYVKIIEKGIQTLKKLKDYELALEALTSLIEQSTYRQQSKAEWYSEKALIYKNTGMHDKAAEVLVEALESDLPNDLKDTLRKRANTLAEQKNTKISEDVKSRLKDLACDGQILENSFPATHIEKQPLENTGKGKIMFEVRTDDSQLFMDAENYCIWHYTNNGSFTEGMHLEGKMVTTIFFLLFWDIIYTKPQGVTGIFMSYYQRYPLDIFTESFYNNREALIVERLQKIENYSEEELINAMHKTWSERPPHELSDLCRCVEWWQVRAVVRLLGARRVAALCARLATRGLHAWHGFPDLTLWNHHTGLIRFVEVKTDLDKPSVRQLQWMDYLRQHDIDVEFCYVGAKTTRCKARASNV